VGGFHAFAGTDNHSDFDPAKVARFTPERVEKFLLNPGIVRK
jgi:3-methyladenine DNA glycosylase Tag